MQQEHIIRIPFFREFGEEDLARLMRFAIESHFERDQVVFREGDMGRELYLVLSGSIRFERNEKNGQQPQVLSQASFGHVFGELAFLKPQPRRATAIASEKTMLLVFAKAQIQKLLDLYPSLAAAFYHAVALEIATRLSETAF